MALVCNRQQRLLFTGYGCGFPEYGFTKAQHLAKTFFLASETKMCLAGCGKNMRFIAI